MTWLVQWWQRLTHGLWFRPSLVATGFVALALLAPLVDRALPEDAWYLYAGGAETARTLLATLAGSLITVLALVFSLTLIAMQLVSTQLTPRALRGFLSAAQTQVAAGTFVGTVLYCFLVVGRVRGEGADSGAHIPHFAVTLGLMLGLFAMVELLFFVNHIANWMQLSSITRRIATSTLETIRRQFPDSLGDAKAGPGLSLERGSGTRLDLRATRSGFVQYFAINRARLTPPRQVRTLHFRCRTGAFVTEGEPILCAWVDGGRDDTGLVERLRSLVVIGDERDIDQDSAFGVRQLVDIALRALSPGVNDPTTAVACVHYLGMLLRELSRRHVGTQLRQDGETAIRIPGPDFEAYVELAFDEIHHFGASQPRVVHELAGTLRKVEAAAEEIGATDRVRYLRGKRERFAGQLVPACQLTGLYSAPSSAP